MLENIVAGLFEQPLKKHDLDSQNTFSQPKNLAASNNWKNLDPKTLDAMELKLTQFQDYKTRHKNNLERLKLAQKEIDYILMDPTCPSLKLREKIKEIEYLGKEITHYKENAETRKKEMDTLSQQLLLLIQAIR